MPRVLGDSPSRTVSLQTLIAHVKNSCAHSETTEGRFRRMRGGHVPKIGKSGASQHVEAEGFEGHYEDLDG